MSERPADRARGLQWWSDPAHESATTAFGSLMLALAVAATITLPPGPLATGFALLATAFLARDRRLGPLGAALLVVLVLPFGRAADNEVLRVVGTPIRPQDAAIGLGLILAVPRLRWPGRNDAAMMAVMLFLVVGIGALAIGLAGGNALHDAVRDVRWWFLYGTALVAVVSRAQRRQVLRAFLVGAVLYSVVLLLVLFLPSWDGGLKQRSLEYGWGVTRLQFSNSPFVIVAALFVAARVMRRPRALPAGILLLLTTATVLSVTRMSILVLAVALVLVAVLTATWTRRRVQARRVAAGILVAAGCALVAVPIGLSLLAVIPVGGVPALVAGSGSGPGGGPADPVGEGPTDTSPINRLFFQGEESGVAAIEAGRMGAYREALKVIATAPVVGHGIGILVDRGFTFGGSEPSTPGRQPGVDNAYLTVAMKAGIVGVLAYLAMVLAPLWVAARRFGRRRLSWFLPAWLAILGLTMTQSFATSGYGPFAVALLLACPSLFPARMARAAR